MMNRRRILTAIALCLGLIFSRCEQEDDFYVRNLNHNIIMILGHGGMGDLYKFPNNSLEAIVPVIGIGADGSELDVQITKDSVLILFHDATLDGRTRCDAYGSPYEYNWEEIKQCYYNTMTGNIPIYTVEEVFDRLPGLQSLYFSFDCKLADAYEYDENYRHQFLRAIKRICEQYDMAENIFIEGTMDFLLTARELGMQNKGFVAGSTVDEAVENNIFGIGTTVNTDPAEIEYAHANGIHVMMWGAKTDAGNKKAISLNPDILQTDKPILILMLFNRFNYDYKIP
jgi:glycerophosphoryl diester phosphodiesterase